MFSGGKMATFKEKFDKVLLGYLHQRGIKADSIDGFEDYSYDRGCHTCGITEYEVHIYYTIGEEKWKEYIYDGHFSGLLEGFLDVEVE